MSDDGVFHGVRGTGFSVQTRDPKMLTLLPKVLRAVADSIEQETEDPCPTV